MSIEDLVEQVVESEDCTQTIQTIAAECLYLIVHDLKNKMDDLQITQEIHSESAKVKFISAMLHTIMPKLVAQLSEVSTDEHNLDLVITQVFLDHE